MYIHFSSDKEGIELAAKYYAEVEKQYQQQCLKVDENILDTIEKEKNRLYVEEYNKMLEVKIKEYVYNDLVKTKRGGR